MIAYADDTGAEFMKESRCVASHVAKALDDNARVPRRDIQYAKGAFSQKDDPSAGRFAAAQCSAAGEWFAGYNFPDSASLVHGIGVHEPRHNLFIGAHVWGHDVGV